MGKTRLAREAVTEAAGPGGAARWAVASTAAQRVPLGAFASFTGQALDVGADASLLAHAARLEAHPDPCPWRTG